MTDLMDQDAIDPDEPIKLSFGCTQDNYMALIDTAISQGETKTNVINRAIAMYALIMAADPGTPVRWADHDGGRHQLVVIK